MTSARRAAGSAVLAALGAAVLTGCQTVQPTPWDAAQDAMARGDLLVALELLDVIPPTHARYTDARTHALAIERRMRSAHERIREGLELRAQWRDEEAQLAFARAVEIWPRLDEAKRLLRATQQRHRMLQAGGVDDPLAAAGAAATPPGRAVETSPILDRDAGEVAGADAPAADTSAGDADDPAVPAAPGGAVPPIAGGAPGDVEGADAGDTVGDREEHAAPPSTDVPRHPAGPVEDATRSATEHDLESGDGAPPRPVASAQNGTTPAPDPARVAEALEGVRVLLARGELDEAVLTLRDLRRRFPESPPVQMRLVNVLHQRALLRYGQGDLRAALIDWHEVRKLQPDHAQANEFARAAEAELATAGGR